MNGRHDEPSPGASPLLGQSPGDEALGVRIRELAARWEMPTGTEAARSWSDRVRPGKAARGWTGVGRMLTAAGLAVALTFVGAVVVVWLGLPGQKSPTGVISASPKTSASPRPRPTVNPGTLYSAPPTTTPRPTLPAYALTGPSLAAEQVIVDAGAGPALLDIASGQLTATPSTAGQSYAQLFALPDGSFLCACATALTGPDSTGTKMQSTASLTLRWFATDGSPGRTVILPTYVGRADPGVSNEPDHAVLTASLGPAGTTLEIGWAIEVPPVWRSGIDVVDLAAGRVVQTLNLPDEPDQAAGVSAGVDGATMTFAPDGRTAMIERLGWTTVAGSAETSWHAIAPFNGGRLGPPAPVAAGPAGLDGPANCAAFSGPAGFTIAASYYTICSSEAGALLRRVDRSGRPLGDTPLTDTASASAGLGFAVDQARQLLYAWDPFARSLQRVDLLSGLVTGRGTLPATAVTGDPLGDAARAFARWLAPSVSAKVYLSPSLVLSADGSRLFAIGTAATDPLTPAGGSTGIWVFDTATLQVVDHWSPDADYVSLALNHDGSLILAAGMPGTDAGGTQSDQGASVTIYDTATGAIRAVAGEVAPSSAGWVMFPTMP